MNIDPIILSMTMIDIITLSMNIDIIMYVVHHELLTLLDLLLA